MNGDTAGGTYPPSPVPADAHLLPGDLPFTAFGQGGEGQMDNRVFDQDVYWVNIKGEPFLLNEMPEDYRRNVITFLLDNVDYFHANACLRAALTAVEDAFHGRPNGDLLAEQFGIPFITDIDPVDWLEATPLMRRLRALTPKAA